MSKKQTIQAGLVGCGAIAMKGLIPGWMPKFHPNRPKPPPFLEFGGSEGLSIVGICDVNATQLANAKEILPKARTFSSWDEMRIIKSDLDAIIVATPNHLHEQMVLDALEDGHHVFVEKPFALTFEGIDKICEATVRFKKIVMVDLPWRFSSITHCLNNALQQDMIGKLIAIQGEFRHSGPRAWSPDADWYFSEKNPGGALTDLGPHLLDMLTFLAGKPVGQITCLSNKNQTTYDRATCNFICQNNVEACAVAGWDSVKPIFQVFITGTRGMLHGVFTGQSKGVYFSKRCYPVELNELGGFELKAENNANWKAVQINDLSFENNPFAHFIHCVHTGQSPITGVDAVKESQRLVIKTLLILQNYQ